MSITKKSSKCSVTLHHRKTSLETSGVFPPTILPTQKFKSWFSILKCQSWQVISVSFFIFFNSSQIKTIIFWEFSFILSLEKSRNWAFSWQNHRRCTIGSLAVQIRSTVCGSRTRTNDFKIKNLGWIFEFHHDAEFLGNGNMLCSK